VVDEGSQAPDFELKSDAGETVKLSQFRGRPVVLYFYPKDDTPGCTKEACAFRDSYDEYLARNAVILGVSRDGEESHRKFKQKYDLPFTLLSDPDHEVAEAYGVWAEKSMYGRKSMGIVRSTFVIAADGTIATAMRGIKVPGHSDKVLEALAA
jgi:peroxiredoxin Q/BCP